MSNYAIIHIEKGGKSAKGLGQHCDRTKEVLNADPERSHLNHKVVLIENKLRFIELGKGKPLEDLVEERIRSGYKGVKAIRKDAVRHLSIILTGSHEHMKGIEADAEKLKKWIGVNYVYIAKTFGGKENIVGFYVHRDEKTLHIHAQVVPITGDGRLCARDFIGSPEKLRTIQDSYAEGMQKNIDQSFERGVKGSKAKHTDLDWFYGKVQELKDHKGINFSGHEFRFEPDLKSVDIAIKPNVLGYYTQKDLERLEAAQNRQLEELKRSAQASMDRISKVAQDSEHQMRVMKHQKKYEALRGKQITIEPKRDQSKGVNR